jgi:uncharacterized protein with FMN-binding domain
MVQAVQLHSEEICMSRSRSQAASTFSRALRKVFLSGFVVLSFIAYAIHERLTNLGAGSSLAPYTPEAVTGSGAAASADSAATATPAPAGQPLPAPVAASGQSGYKDGTFTGPEVDAYYGLVKVQATIQNGKIADVQFLEFPNDRRTSVQINTIAVPYLQQEALQAQSANVDIISGATLTSEGFMMSLQSALATANK